MTGRQNEDRPNRYVDVVEAAAKDPEAWEALCDFALNGYEALTRTWTDEDWARMRAIYEEEQ